MKKINLFFEAMLAIIFWVLMCVCLVLGFTYLAWWQFAIAGAACVISWMMTREIYRELQVKETGIVD